MSNLKKIWNKSKKFIFAALFTGSLYAHLYPDMIKHYNYTSQERMVDNAFKLIGVSKEDVNFSKLIDKYNDSVDIVNGNLSNLNTFEKIIEYDRKYDISKNLLIYFISLTLFSSLYKVVGNQNPLIHLLKLSMADNNLNSSKKKKSLEDILNSRKELSKSFFGDGRKVINSINDIEISESIKNLYEFEKNMPEKNNLADIGSLISQSLVGIPVYLIVNLIKSRTSNQIHLLQDIYLEEYVYKSSKIIPFYKLFWNRLHKLNPDIGLYALEALFYKNKKSKQVDRLWNKLVDEIVFQGLENKFQKIGDSRNDVFNFNLGDLSFILKKSKKKENLEIEFNNLTKMLDLENVVIPLKLFEHNSNYFLITMFEKSKTLFDYVKNKSLDDKIDLLQKSTSNMYKVHNLKKISSDLDDILSIDNDYFLNRVNLVSYKLNLPNTLKLELSNGFLSISKRLFNIKEDSELNEFLMKIYGDMNPKNFLISEKNNKIEQKLCDFESNYLLPVLLDYISLWEFERMYIPTEIVNENILNSIAGNNNHLRDKIEPYIDIARIQRHWEIIGYTKQNFNRKHELNNLTYEFYHKAMIEEALDRLIKKGYDELRPLEKAISNLDPFEYFV